MSKKQFLYTPRLRVEPLQLTHASVVFPAQQDPAIYQYIPGNALSLEELTRRYRFLEKGHSPDEREHWLNWIAFLKETDIVIGTFQATIPPNGEASIAYTVFPSFWRQGYATELGLFMLSHIFKTHAPHTIVAEIDTRNIPSILLVQRWGFSKIKTTKDADFFNGSSSDEFTYALTYNEWSNIESFKDVHKNK